MAIQLRVFPGDTSRSEEYRVAHVPHVLYLQLVSPAVCVVLHQGGMCSSHLHVYSAD